MKKLRRLIISFRHAVNAALFFLSLKIDVPGEIPYEVHAPFYFTHELIIFHIFISFLNHFSSSLLMGFVFFLFVLIVSRMCHDKSVFTSLYTASWNGDKLEQRLYVTLVFSASGGSLNYWNISNNSKNTAFCSTFHPLARVFSPSVKPHPWPFFTLLFLSAAKLSFPYFPLNISCAS